MDGITNHKQIPLDESTKFHKRLVGRRNRSISQVCADQSSQNHEHAEKPNDFPHARTPTG